ncbi:MAG TPA: glycosyltransferase [Candidatus Hydrogenedentes bacterium]|nr:glycosyltransferase [Candidatus Hydrogenedentota bacterium]HOL76769.1 glycosyltransferase [Candidatus Hydrogenedentota bacterium]HPO85270.1 glycosyltransferase [Candidatus Hydrogenedentota bacterium]
MLLEELQEQKLRERAERTGVWYDLVSFLAVRRDLSAIEDVYRRLPISHERDRAICEVFLQEISPVPPNHLHARLHQVNDPWLYYTHTKGLLRKDHVAEALSLAREHLVRNPHDTTCINLIYRYLLKAGEKSLAQLLLDTTLGANPIQKDMEYLLNAASQTPLYLDTFPKRFSISFYLPVYNVEHHLAYTLEAVFGQNYPLYEVIVANDASPDRSREIAQAYPVKIVDHPENRGLAAARNTAFHTAAGDFVATVDTDAYPTPHFLRNIMMEFENGDPRIAGAGGRFLELYREQPADLYRSRYLHQDGGEHRECPAPMLFGCNTVFRKDDVLSVGGYDEKYRTHGEDADISRRLADAGFWLLYTPHGVAYHMRRDTPETVLQTRWKYYFWYLEENGYYASPTQLVHLFLEYVKVCASRIQKDINDHCESLLYLHVLMVVHNTFLDLRQAQLEKTFTPAQARGLQQTLWNAFLEIDREFDGNLAPAIMRDTTHLLVGSPTIEPPPQTGLFAEGFSVFLAHLKSILSKDIYPLICQSAATCEQVYRLQKTEKAEHP